LTACAVQQELIGRKLGKYEKVRRMVGVHKPFIRAVEAILSKPGLSFGKCMILCGGPDWPTSVLAGILRLSLPQCMLGTSPIVSNVAPFVLTGSFYLKRDVGLIWARAGNLMLTFTIGTSMVFWAGMAWAIQNEFENNYEAITAPKLEYVDLQWQDHRAASIAERCRITWADVPSWVRIPFLVGAAGIMFVGHCVACYSSFFFGKFEVTDEIASLQWLGQGGIISWLGAYGLLGGSACCVGLVMFCIWESGYCRTPARLAAEELDKEEESWKQAKRQEAEEAFRQPSVERKDTWLRVATEVKEVAKECQKTQERQERRKKPRVSRSILPPTMCAEPSLQKVQASPQSQPQKQSARLTETLCSCLQLFVGPVGAQAPSASYKV